MVPNFIKKGLVALVAILTFGTVIPVFPAHYVDKQGDKESIQKEKTQDSPLRSYGSTSQEETQANPTVLWGRRFSADVSKETLISAFSSYALLEAEQQGFHKFGTRVSEKIGNQYMQEIAPSFVSAIEEVSNAHDESWIRTLAVTHSPSSGMGERILHVYQTGTGNEVLKLHVRRDHPPQDGYWFDFHYHTVSDGFQKHHELKKVFWGKNMPPKWKI
ncbi:YpjP family protein [Sporolactobacillus pectinivorans]|uniref:YpjP family protein n=1 Tax=Sporolactobacillus pectinivorans TaxID=1591408 RepID=UPI000C266D92|nr:YpjP family protein [Sporolactobacillus pectinivorans]